MQAAGSSGSQCEASALAGSDIESNAQASAAATAAKQSNGRLLGPPLIKSNRVSPTRAAAYHRTCSFSAAEWENGFRDRTAWELKDDGPLGRPGARV